MAYGIVYNGQRNIYWVHMDIRQTDYENYWVDSNANVYSTWHGYFKRMEPRIDTDGYYRVNLTINGLQKRAAVHRLFAIAFIPNPNNLPQIDHINRVRTDNRIENLRWVTCSQNHYNRTTRISDEVKKEIYYLVTEKGYTQKAIVKLFGVSKGTVYNIVTRDKAKWCEGTTIPRRWLME